MRTAGADTDDDIALGNRAAIEHLAALDGAHGEARKVVLAGCVHVRHLRSFATDQGSAGLHAALGDTRNHGAGDIVVQLAAGEIVEEKQGLSALDEHIVDAHGDEIDTNRVMDAKVLGQHELGADAIRTGYQHWLLIAPRRQRKQATKPTETGKHLGASSAFHERLDALNEFVPRVDVDAGVFVRKWFIAHFGVAYSARAI